MMTITHLKMKRKFRNNDSLIRMLKKVITLVEATIKEEIIQTTENRADLQYFRMCMLN